MTMPIAHSIYNECKQEINKKQIHENRKDQIERTFYRWYLQTQSTHVKLFEPIGTNLTHLPAQIFSFFLSRVDIIISV